MARRIIWSFRAQKDRKLILDFWIKKTLSTAYSKKLNGIFIDTIKIIAEFPKIGKKSNIEGVRVKVVRDYLIIYEEKNDSIIVLTIWDSRQYQDKLGKMI
jgi:plasmid stabilization system protein ParE